MALAFLCCFSLQGLTAMNYVKQTNTNLSILLLHSDIFQAHPPKLHVSLVDHFVFLLVALPCSVDQPSVVFLLVPARLLIQSYTGRTQKSSYEALSKDIGALCEHCFSVLRCPGHAEFSVGISAQRCHGHVHFSVQQCRGRAD